MHSRILIVDDHDDFRKMVKNYLMTQDLDAEIFEAWTAEMAVAKASCVKPHIVLMDINLPKSNGIEATRYILEDNNRCRVILLTMFEVDAFRQASQRIKASEFVGKSEVYERLVPAIKRCLKDM